MTTKRDWVDGALWLAEVSLLFVGYGMMAAIVAAVLVSACGGETTTAPSSAPATTCRDEAHREADVDLVVCSEHARIERADGWIVCRCTPAPSTGGTP